MQVLSRLEPLALERELLDRIDAAHPRTEPGRTLVLVPTTRLATHLQRRLADRRPAWLGLRVMNFSGLAREILRLHSDGLPHVASDLLLEALLGRLAADQPRNPWIAFARERPGALRTLYDTLKDLREAAVEPRIVAECCPDGGLAEIFETYHETLEAAGRDGWTDRAGLVRLATAHAATFAEACGAIFVHGAYEWTGVNLELLRELDRSRELTVFMPAQPGRPVSRFAENFAVEYLADSPIDDRRAVGQPGPGEPRLDALFDEVSRPAPAGADRLSFAHTQGASAEVKLAVREALSAIAAGCPPTEIVLTARSLAPYAAALEEIFDEEGLAWTSSLATPLRRRPVVRDLLLLLKVVAEEFPREATVALMRSPWIDWSVLLGEDRPAPLPELADRWSREANLIGGIEDWTLELPRWARVPKTYPGQAERARKQAEEQALIDGTRADGIARHVIALDAAVQRDACRWSAHAERLRSFLGIVSLDLDDEDDAGALAVLSDLLEEMTRLETVVGDAEEVTFERMRDWLDLAVDRSQLELHGRDGGGIRVLDAMQLRGLTFQHVHLLGMNSGLFPRSPREDPILDDGARREIAARSGRPLRGKLEAADEERLLLAILLGSASDAVHVSWQRADQSGKTQAPSLALRELARLRFGEPDLNRLLQDARHLRSHPAQELRDLLAAPGLLSPPDEMLLTALSSGGVSQANDLGERFEALKPGLAMLKATESWEVVGPEYDARVGARLSDSALSVSALETLGTCPLQFFFKEVLRVEELPDEPSPFSIPARELGSALHDLLEQAYATLRDEGLFDEGRSVDLVERGLELLDRSRGSLFGDPGRRAARRLPVLWSQLEQNWLSALKLTVRADLTRVEKNRLELQGIEEQRRESVDFGQGVTLELSARFDRRFEGGGCIIVGDYKTSKNLSLRVNPTYMLKGVELQVPLYQVLAGPRSVVEILGIHPELAEEDTRELFGGFDDDERGESFRDTIRVLLGLNSGGVFPLRENGHCQWCRFRSACRRNHPPTMDREGRTRDSEAYRALSNKSNKKPIVKKKQDSDD